MVIDDELADFVESPVMIIVGTAGPEIARAAGARVDRVQGRITLLVSAWLWPEATTAMMPGDRIAATFARPADYVSLQVKGVVEQAGPADDSDQARATRYVAAVTATLTELGLAPEIIEPWQTDRQLARIDIRPEAVFVQTPGPQAGLARP